ncbi:glycoside-pentoside-hexuronide (GPH):cation symporter [Alitiscatomonas sp.]|uniref:MFS transporter n=1 Tax=Alitiscatomonas sp. TaxID=2981647 RepID=UPI001C0317AD|nr:glycoside-pentoside-hexuronide (GPH):cation symporter [Lachnospiraceae bacterium]
MSKEKNIPGNVQEDQRDRKMSKGELVSYGLGGVASTMPSQFKTAYAMNFMSDVAGLHVGAVGILNTLLIIWDAINDPIIGGIADRTNTKRWGKYRPHMIMGILLWAVIMVMLFTVPDLPETGMWIYYIVALLLYSVFYTQFTVPWQALNSAMTRDPQERNLMLTCRQYGGFIAGAVVGVITIPIVQKSADPRTGWLISVGIVCVTMIITGLCAANGAKRVDYYNSLPTPEKIHFKSQIGLVIHNRAVICAALLLGAVTLVNTMSSALSLYYLRCVVENMGLKAVFSLVSLGISLVVIPMMPAMLRKFGKIKTVFIGMFVILLQSIWLLVRREYATDLEVIGMGFVGSLGFVFANVAVLAMIPDCTDYTEWKFGTAQAGFINATITFMKKFCSSFSTMIVGVALASVGYSASETSQEVIDMIVNLKIAYPIVLMIVTVILVKLYPITPAFAKTMRAELKQRREAAKKNS